MKEQILNHLMAHDTASVEEIYNNTSITIPGDWKSKLRKELGQLEKRRTIHKVKFDTYRIDSDVKYHREKKNGQSKLF